MRRGLEWKNHGICAQADPEAFFPEKGEPSLPAKRICNGHKDTPPCPVLLICRQYAIDRPEEQGVWGGTSYKERKAMRRLGIDAAGYQHG